MSSEPGRDATVEALRRLASGVREPAGPDATFRLLEKVSQREEAEQLRAALTELGAESVLEDSRAHNAVGRALEVFADDLAAARW